MIDMDKLISKANKKMLCGQRKGQAYFNALYEINIPLAESICGSDVDPFYDDNKLPNFIRLVATHDGGEC